MSAFERFAIQRLIDQATAVGVDIPCEVTAALLHAHGGSTGGRLWAEQYPDADPTGCCYGDALTGHDPVESQLAALTDPHAVLCRSKTIIEAEAGIDAGKRVALVGGGTAMRQMAEAAIDLKAGRGTSHPELFAFTTWAEVQAYASQEEDGSDLRVPVNLIDSRTPEGVLAIVDELVDERRADLVVSTTHKAKGREWTTVRIADDFPEPRPTAEHPRPQVSREAAMLAYVSVTRARHVLDREGLAWVDDWTAP